MNVSADRIDVRAQVTLFAGDTACRDLLLTHESGETIEVAQLPGVKFVIAEIHPWEPMDEDLKMTFDLVMTSMPEAEDHNE